MTNIRMAKILRLPSLSAEARAQSDFEMTYKAEATIGKLFKKTFAQFNELLEEANEKLLKEALNVNDAPCGLKKCVNKITIVS